VLTWLNLESKEEVDDLYRLWSDSKAKLIFAPECTKDWRVAWDRFLTHCLDDDTCTDGKTLTNPDTM